MKVLICDDQAIVRDGMELLLKLEKDIEVTGKASNGSEALELIAHSQPDLVLMDLKMPVMNGIEATRRIQRQFPQTKVLILTTFEEDEWLFDALQAGASGYLLKDTPRGYLIKAIRDTIEGKTYLDPVVAGRILDKAVGPQTRPSSWVTDKLTERETVVLRLLADGMNNQEIARELHLSQGTVRNHVSAIFSKLEVSDRIQAALVAIRHGLVS